MAVADALARLESHENEKLNAVLGDLLRIRARADDWHRCFVLQSLERNDARLVTWRELLTRAEAAGGVATLNARARELLNPESADFDDKIDDFIAELVAAVWLSLNGYEEIRFTPGAVMRTPDLTARKGRNAVAVEVKNLRDAKTVTSVAFRRWHANRAENPERYNFDVQIESLGDTSDLVAEQETALHHFIDQLPNWLRPSDRNVTLPGGRTLRIAVRDGRGVMLQHGGAFNLAEAVQEVEQALVFKALDPAKKALQQLFWGTLSVETEKIVFLRWRPPDRVFMEVEDIRTRVRSGFQQFLERYFPGVKVVMVHTLETFEQFRLNPS